MVQDREKVDVRCLKLEEELNSIQLQFREMENSNKKLYEEGKNHEKHMLV